MEVSVGFTDKDEKQMAEEGYLFEKSEFGNVYYPKEGVAVQEIIIIKYVEYPWITCFEVEGVEISVNHF